MKAEARVLRSALMFERLRKKALEKPDGAKGFLGPSLRENPSVPSIGRRVAVGRGLIVDDAGKMRCPAGTPNANQFTDLQMSNCMIPSMETAANEVVDAASGAVEKASEAATGTRLSTFTPSEDAARIKQKNDEILTGIAAAGGRLNNVDEEYAAAEQGQPGGVAAYTMTHEQHTAQRKEFQRIVVDLLKRASTMRDDRLDENEVEEYFSNNQAEQGAWSKPLRTIISDDDDERNLKARKKFIFKLFGGKFKNGSEVEGVSPKVLDFLRTASVEEIEETLDRAVRDFHNGLDPRVHVQIPEARLVGLFDDGRYKTTHEARSEHSGPDIRTAYEATLGIARETPAELRPASGYVVHQDWEKAMLKTRQDVADGRRVPDERIENVRGNTDVYGTVGIYGGVTMRLKPELSERTYYGWGDSFNNLIDPAPLRPDAETDDLGNAVLQRRFKNGSMSETGQAVLSFLDAYLHNDWSRLRTQSKETNYAEALVMGSFELKDIEEIEIPWDNIPWLPETYFSRRSYEPQDSRGDMQLVNEFADSMQNLFDDVASSDRLAEFGAQPEEIEEIRKQIDGYLSKRRTDITFPRLPRSEDFPNRHGMTQTQQRLFQYIAILSMTELKDKANENGIRVKTISNEGLDRWDIASYGPEDQKIGDISEIWRNRLTKAMIEDIRRIIEIRNRPEREFVDI